MFHKREDKESKPPDGSSLVGLLSQRGFAPKPATEPDFAIRERGFRIGDWDWGLIQDWDWGLRVGIEDWGLGLGIVVTDTLVRALIVSSNHAFTATWTFQLSM